MSARQLTPAALEAWLARYGEAWEQRDPARAAALFTENAPYHEMPFEAPKAGRLGGGGHCDHRCFSGEHSPDLASQGSASD